MVKERSVDCLVLSLLLNQPLWCRRKFYDLLDVPVDVSEADLKKAYRKKYQFFLSCLYYMLISYRALRLHPDKGGDHELFKEVSHA